MFTLFPTGPNIFIYKIGKIKKTRIYIAKTKPPYPGFTATVKITDVPAMPAAIPPTNIFKNGFTYLRFCLYCINHLSVCIYITGAITPSKKKDENVAIAAEKPKCIKASIPVTAFERKAKLSLNTARIKAPDTAARPKDKALFMLLG